MNFLRKSGAALTRSMRVPRTNVAVRALSSKPEVQVKTVSPTTIAEDPVQDGIYPLQSEIDEIEQGDFQFPIKFVDGERIATIEGQEVVIADCQPTLEWVLTSPVEEHLFDELPVVKESPDSGVTKDH